MNASLTLPTALKSIDNYYTHKPLQIISICLKNVAEPTKKISL